MKFDSEAKYMPEILSKRCARVVVWKVHTGNTRRVMSAMGQGEK
jgi:hypothetical protein